MKRNVYALMIGIDDYPIAHHKLRGCVNDMKAVKEYLEGRFDKENFNLNIKELTDKDATRDNIIDGFLNHLTQAGKDDIVFIHYSGHGSQVPAPKEFWHSEPDKLVETMVCWDSRIEGGFDLASKELSYLIWKVAQKEPHIVVLFDCCHSGSGTRDANSETFDRMAEVGNTERPIESFVGYNEYNIDKETGQVDPPIGRHILLAAARDNETAKETNMGGIQGGVFTHSLLKSLRDSKGTLSYADLMNRTQTQVYNRVDEQHPQLEAIEEVDKFKSFLNGSILPKPDYYTVVYDAAEDSWIMNVGELHGIQSGTKLALFDEAATNADMNNIDKAIGELEVDEAYAEKSLVLMSGIDSNDQEKVYKAKVTEIPIPPLKVFLDESGDKEGVNAAKAILKKSESTYIELVKDRKLCQYQILAKNHQYWVTPPDSEKPVFKRIDGYDDDNSELLVLRLIHLAKWRNTFELSNPNTGLEDSDIEITMSEVLDMNRRGKVTKENIFDLTEPVHLEYKFDSKKNKWAQPRFRFKIKNTSPETLYVSLLYMSEDFSADNKYVPIQRLDPGEEVYAKYKPKGKDFFIDAVRTGVPGEFTSWGITSINDLLKVFVSTVEFNTNIYNLDALELDVKRKDTTRATVDDDDDEFASGNTADWMTKDVHFTVTRPLDSVDLSDEDVTIHGMTVAAHSGLKAKINLSTQKEATRAVGGADQHKAVPTALMGNPNIQDMALNQPQGKAAPLSILEITDVTDTNVVNENAPLELSLGEDLAENEMVLPIGYDESTGSFIPLGGSSTDAEGHTKITIDQLPEPTPAGTRSLGGSIKIFFKKVVLSKLGKPYEYPILAEGIVSEDGEDLKYNKDKDDIKAKVANANKIVVFVHGIIGDTKDMTKAVRKGRLQNNGSTKYMGDLYDLVLTFDYENLNTRIQETGRLFKERLEEIGLGEGHGKTVHIVAHSMGGLVSRWMIEKEGGDKIVDHLIQLGTPNGGSAWSDVYKWAKVAMSFVLGKVSISAIYLAPLSFLLKQADDKMFITLKQMNAQSEFIEDLNSSTNDPKVPYTIICGDTSQIPRMQEADVQKTIKGVLAKLGNDGQAKLIDDMIFKSRNDIAVAVDSIKEVSDNRNPAPQKIEVACDHMSYFVTDAGLNALTETVYRIANNN